MSEGGRKREKKNRLERHALCGNDALCENRDLVAVLRATLK